MHFADSASAIGMSLLSKVVVLYHFRSVDVKPLREAVRAVPLVVTESLANRDTDHLYAGSIGTAQLPRALVVIFATYDIFNRRI